MKKSIQSTAELARHLGLSRWAVSRAINGHDKISAETAERVRAAMDEFGFTPSPHARGLRGRRTGVVGVCFRNFETATTVQKIALIQRLVSQRGYMPLLAILDAGTNVARRFIALRIEGVVLVDLPEREEGACLALFRKHSIPTVVADPLGAPSHNAVYIDRESALRRIMDRLIELGHRRFALLGIDRRMPNSRRRHAGVVRSLVAHHLDPRACLTTFIDPEYRRGGLNYGRDLAERLLNANLRQTALLAVNDAVAAGALWRLQKAGLNCPRDFSIVGFDNHGLSRETSPPMSSVDHEIETFSAAVVAMLMEMIERGPRARRPVVNIEPRVIFRESIAMIKERAVGRP